MMVSVLRKYRKASVVGSDREQHGPQVHTFKADRKIHKPPARDPTA